MKVCNLNTTPKFTAQKKDNNIAFEGMIAIPYLASKKYARDFVEGGFLPTLYKQPEFNKKPIRPTMIEFLHKLVTGEYTQGFLTGKAPTAEEIKAVQNARVKVKFKNPTTIEIKNVSGSELAQRTKNLGIDAKVLEE